MIQKMLIYILSSTCFRLLYSTQLFSTYQLSLWASYDIDKSDHEHSTEKRRKWSDFVIIRLLICAYFLSTVVFLAQQTSIIIFEPNKYSFFVWYLNFQPCYLFLYYSKLLLYFPTSNSSHHDRVTPSNNSMVYKYYFLICETFFYYR